MKIVESVQVSCWGLIRGTPVEVVASVDTHMTDAGVHAVFNIAVDRENKKLWLWHEVWR